ncbi:MAG: mismatch-specific DNA-glycosylase [Anaerolineae bacterium]
MADKHTLPEGVSQAVILPDVLRPGLQIVFCGTAASDASAAAGAYYAGPGNAFWPTLYAVGFTPRLLAPAEFRLLPAFGLGLTDLAKFEAGVDSRLSAGAFDADALQDKIVRFRPAVVAFTSKTAARAYYGRRVDYGWQPSGIGPARGYVLPSPSGAARRYWDVVWWQALADAFRRSR